MGRKKGGFESGRDDSTTTMMPIFSLPTETQRIKNRFFPQCPSRGKWTMNVGFRNTEEWRETNREEKKEYVMFP